MRIARRSANRQPVTPALRDGLLLAAVCGAVLVLLWPAARAQWTWLGWGPLWLVGMPLAAWWMAAGRPRPIWTGSLRVGRRGPQARRVGVPCPRRTRRWAPPAAGSGSHR